MDYRQVIIEMLDQLTNEQCYILYRVIQRMLA